MLELPNFPSLMFSPQEQNQVPNVFVANDATGRGVTEVPSSETPLQDVKLYDWKTLSNRHTAVKGDTVEPKVREE